MKKVVLTLTLVLLAFTLFAQTFEGEVIYHNTYTSKMPTLSDAQLTAMIGDTQNWYIKDGEYKSDLNGTYVQWQIYVNSENKLYSKFGNSDVVLYNDAALGESEITDIQINKGVIDILGYKCDELIWKTKGGLQKYYFSSKLPIDSKLFLNHKFGDWSFYLEKANAIPLKMIVETKEFSLECVATAVSPMKLNRTMFAIPANTKTIKSPNL